MPEQSAHRAPVAKFLAGNPFSMPLLDGLFYREKMRAIHRIAPRTIGAGRHRPNLLEIGGGRSGLGPMLYPDAAVVNVDMDASLASADANKNQTFVCADACDLPFEAGRFDLITMFDVIEHIEDDVAAVREAKRVLRPGGTILLSCPDADWHYPHHGFMRGVARDEAELMAEWGHVRRGYTAERLTELFGGPAISRAAFINRWTALFHDIAFSRLPRPAKMLGYAITAPVVGIGYLRDDGTGKGSETAYAWRF